MQEIPNLVGTQAVRNLSALNNGVQGGLLPGLLVQNNVLEEGGLGGVKVQGETPIWMISPSFIPYIEPGTDPAGFLWDGNPFVNTDGALRNPISHFGSYIDDQDTLVIDADRTRVRMEFDDLAGGGTGLPWLAAGKSKGTEYALGSSVAWYRDTGGAFYQRLDVSELHRLCYHCVRDDARHARFDLEQHLGQQRHDADGQCDYRRKFVGP